MFIMATMLKEVVEDRVLKCFETAIQNVFKTMLDTHVRVSPPALKTKQLRTFDISGIISFTGEIQGSCVMRMNNETGINLVEKFAMEKYEIEDEDFIDAYGELCNMVSGNAKKNFKMDAGISISSVIFGSGHMVARLKGVPAYIIYCSTDSGDFVLELNLKQLNFPGR